MNTKFDDIAPLYDHEVKQNIQDILVDPGFEHAVRYIMPDIDWAEFSEGMLQYNTKHEFQTDIIYTTIGMLCQKTTTGVRGENWDRISKDKQHLFLSNHRDIVLDAGLFNILRSGQKLDTTEIAIGDNLLIHPWIEKLVRLNKSFIVRRGLSIKEQLMASKHMSEYIHYCINEKGQSVWMAQREGRAKDANDHTQISLLKMLALAPEKTDFITSLKELNIIPLSISYEYDPCDYLKAKEFQLKRDIEDYKKTQRDDLLNMEIGILGFKGNVVFRFGECINPKLDKITETDKREIVGIVAKIIDEEIHRHYEIYPCNYIAYDIHYKTNRFADKYTKEEAEAFDKYLYSQIKKIDLDYIDVEFSKAKMVEMYSNVLRNHSLANGEKVDE